MLTAALDVSYRAPGISLRQTRRVAGSPECTTKCAACGLRTLCVPAGFAPEDSQAVDHIVNSRRRIRRGEHVYRAGDTFTSLYAFRTGVFKAYMESEDGRTHVTSFHMPGELAGFDGIGTDRHTVSIVALEDGEVCVMPYGHLDGMANEVPDFQHHMHRWMSEEIVREQSQMLLLGTMRAEARLASFLLNLAQRFGARGYSTSEYNLRMTREEIGSFLGLKLETVSRLFSRFQELGFLQVQGRAIKLLDHAALREMAGQRA